MFGRNEFFHCVCLHLMYFLFSFVSSRKKWPHVQWTPTSQYDRHTLHCALCSTSSSSDSNHVLWFFAEKVELSMLLKITWKCMSLRVVLDLLNQISNVDAMWSFHFRMWYSWIVEVNVLLVDCKVELVVRVKWRNVTIFFRSKLFFHCAHLSCFAQKVALFHREHAWRECLQTVSQVSLFYLKSQVLYGNVYHRSRWNGTFWVFVGLVLESLTRGASPKECWASFPTGCCSTVEPNWSFLLVQLWSCFNEIFGGGRVDK